jgi:type I restriction enzyme S subunit
MTMRREAWIEFRLGDLGEVFTGRTPSTEHPAYFGNEYPFITPGDMHQGKYARATERGISFEGATLLKRIKLPANSICVSCIGWQMGEVIMTALPSFTNQQINTIVPNNKVEPSFLYYSLCPRKQELLSLGSAAGVRTPILNKSAFCNLKLRIPPISIQGRITDILSAYDDLIENNTRRSKILEQMAQMLYREWFVNFRFPGHEKVMMVESLMGAIPEGWSTQSVGTVSLNFDSKRKPLSSNERLTRKGPYPYYGAAAIFDYIDDFIFDGVFLLVGEDGSVITPDNKPVLQLTDGKFWPNNHTHVIQGKAPISTHLLYLCLADADVTGCVTGAAQPKITQANLNRIPVIVPTAPVLKMFDGIITPMFLERALLEKKNRNLRNTRDLLLPKLVSGEIEIPDREVVLESVNV